MYYAMVISCLVACTFICFASLWADGWGHGCWVGLPQRILLVYALANVVPCPVIAEYRRLHGEAEHWREIRDGIRAVGILEMEIYIVGSRLFMIVETPLDFDWQSAMACLASLPRQAEWERTVDRFLQCREGNTSAEKWRLMERMFRLYG